MGEEGDELVSEFVAFTGADVSQAKQMLEATGDDLQSAIDLYFATFQKDEDVAQRLHEEEMSRVPLQSSAEEGHVRAPIPSKVDRLYGEYQPVDGLGSRPRAGRAQGSSVPIMDAFRQRSDAAGHGSEPLASMFDPPEEILFQGSFEEAKKKAVADRRWLVLNVQSPSSFDSHRLNRDMWRDGTIQALLETSFVVYQTYDVSQDGESLMGYYAIDRLPVIIMVDPVTGAPMKHWFGFIEASRWVYISLILLLFCHQYTCHAHGNTSNSAALHYTRNGDNNHYNNDDADLLKIWFRLWIHILIIQGQQNWQHPR